MATEQQLLMLSGTRGSTRRLLDMKALLAAPRAPGQQLEQLGQLGQLGIACAGGAWQPLGRSSQVAPKSVRLGSTCANTTNCGKM